MKKLKKRFMLLSVLVVMLLAGFATAHASAASNPTVTTKVTSKSSTVTKTASKKATKTYTVKSNWETTSDKSVVVSATSKKETIKQTTVQKQTLTTYTKGKKAYTVKTTTKTTVKTSVYNLSISAIAPKAGSNVITAWNTLGFKFYIDPNVAYTGLFDVKSRTVTLRTLDTDTAYHELGHFVAFLSGGMDTSSSFKTAYNAEKSLYTSYNWRYVTSTSSEYFAQSYRDYILEGSALKSSRPKTYAVVKTAISKITSAQITKYGLVYSAVWGTN